MHSDRFLQGKVALVTGSTSGIGYACAAALARAGAQVALHGLVTVEEGWSLAQALEAETGSRCCFVAGDLSVPAEVSALISQCQEQLGGPDILVNNGGIQFTASTRDFPLARWQAVIDINLTAAFVATQAALPHMQASGYGRVVNIASVHGLVASANKSAYVAAKHGLVGFTKVVALENANQGITCNAVCPGWVDTAIVQKQVADKAGALGIDEDSARRQLVSEKQPMHQMTPPSAIASLVTYLCSGAANTLTGAALPVDGGWTAQ